MTPRHLLRCVWIIDPQNKAPSFIRGPCNRYLAFFRSESPRFGLSRKIQRLRMYIVTSMPKRISVKLGFVQRMINPPFCSQ